MDAVLDSPSVEIEQKTESSIGQLQVGQELGFEHGMQVQNRFHFADYQVVDQDIELERFCEAEIVVDERDCHLTFHVVPPLTQLMAQAGFVDTFKQSRSEPCMNGICRRDNVRPDAFFLA